MPSPECRESREVPRGTGAVWRAAAMGVLNSMDVDAHGRMLPAPIEAIYSGSPIYPSSPIPNLPPLPPLPPSPVSPFTSVTALPRPVRSSSAPPSSSASNGSNGSPGWPPGSKRAPLGALSGNTTNAIVQAMAREISALEKQNSALKKTMLLQRELINGFCKLQVNGQSGG